MELWIISEPKIILAKSIKLESRQVSGNTGIKEQIKQYHNTTIPQYLNKNVLVWVHSEDRNHTVNLKRETLI